MPDTLKPDCHTELVCTEVAWKSEACPLKQLWPGSVFLYGSGGVGLLLGSPYQRGDRFGVVVLKARCAQSPRGDVIRLNKDQMVEPIDCELRWRRSQCPT